jgi:serine/threonine protein kinase
MPILTDQERIGTKVADKYLLDAILGRGGMGTVFAGRHGLSGRPVAVKVLHPQHVRDPRAVRRFLNEARATASFSHPNVVDVLDVDVLDDGTVFLVFERLEGETLGALLAREGPLSLARATAMILPVLDALGAAHRRGIIHRDLKPDNIFLVRDELGESPVLLDFGIAKMLDAAELSVETVSGAILGTPQYMAPEQALGVTASAPQVDVYAAGVVLFECLAGRRPIDGPNPAAILARLVTGQAPSLTSVAPDVPENISAVVAKALASLPENRYPTCEQLAGALTREAESLGVEVAAIERTRRARSSARFNADDGLAGDDRAARELRVESLGATLSEDEFAALRPANPTPNAPSFAERGVARPGGRAAEPENEPVSSADRSSLVGVVIAVAFVGFAVWVTGRGGPSPATAGTSPTTAGAASVRPPTGPTVGSLPIRPATAAPAPLGVLPAAPASVGMLIVERASDASAPAPSPARERAPGDRVASPPERPRIARSPAPIVVRPAEGRPAEGRPNNASIPSLNRAPEVAQEW